MEAPCDLSAGCTHSLTAALRVREQVRSITIKCDGTRSYRHKWPRKIDSAFLSRALVAVQARAAGRVAGVSSPANPWAVVHQEASKSPWAKARSAKHIVTQPVGGRVDTPAAASGIMSRVLGMLSSGQKKKVQMEHHEGSAPSAGSSDGRREARSPGGSSSSGSNVSVPKATAAALPQPPPPPGRAAVAVLFKQWATSIFAKEE